MPGPDTDASDGAVPTPGELPTLALASRAVAFLALWSIVAETDPSSMIVGSATALVAAWVSLRLLPAGRVWPRPAPLARLACRFAWQSLFAGADVARRAMDPRLPLRTGFVRYPVRMPPGPARAAFTALASVVPGTLPAGFGTDGALRVHCLDVETPVAAQLAEDEAGLADALGVRLQHG